MSFVILKKDVDTGCTIPELAVMAVVGRVVCSARSWDRGDSARRDYAPDHIRNGVAQRTGSTTLLAIEMAPSYDAPVCAGPWRVMWMLLASEMMSLTRDAAFVTPTGPR
jgi:hypothetical protein